MDELEFLHQEINSFIGKVPSAIINYGTTVLFLLTTLLIVGAAFFKYPNTVKTTILIERDTLSKSQFEEFPIGNMILTSSQVSQVGVGQKVVIKLTKLPTAEYDLLEGKVNLVSSVKRNREGRLYYMARVKLPDDFILKFGKEIKFDGALEGKADIIISEESLLSRIFFPLKLQDHR